MAGARTILATAFEPFGGETINASWEAVRRLEGWRTQGHVVRTLQLPCAYDGSVEAFKSACVRLRPDIVIATGQAAGGATIRVERKARNRDDALAPDNRGIVRGRGGAIVSGGRETFVSSAPVARIARAIRAAGLPARVSNSAGGFVCNHLYYLGGRFLAEDRPSVPFAFLHVPAAPGQAAALAGAPQLETDDAARAIRIAIETM